MRNTTVIKKEGMDCLIKTLGVLETEVFISSISRENFDYTEWQQDLWKGKTIEEIHHAATAFYTERHGLTTNNPEEA